MKDSKSLFLPIILASSTLSLSAQTIEIDFEDPNELADNWVQTYGLPDTFAQTAGSGVGGSTGLVHVDDITQDFQVNSVHQTSVGGFQNGLTMEAKVHFQQINSSNVVHFGFTTDPNGVASLSGSQVTADWMGVLLSARSTLTTFRLEAYGFDFLAEGDPKNYRSGAGHPESFVPIPDGSGGVADGITPVDVWLGLRVTFIDLGDGNWDVQAVMDVLSADGTDVTISNYAVYNYSFVAGLDDGHTSHDDLSGFSDFYNATDLYPFLGSQRGALRNFGGLDDVKVSVMDPIPTWYGYAVDENSWVNTGSWMGYVNVIYDPWIWNTPLDNYIYAEDDSGWVYLPK